VHACTWVVPHRAGRLYAQGTAFTYQGRLNDSGSPANGNYDLEFTLFDAATTNGNQIGGTVTNLGVSVNNGLFTTTIDFGSGIFTGNPLWLQIGVETNGGGGNFTLLGALQPPPPTPCSIYATSAGTATTASSVSAGRLNHRWELCLRSGGQKHQWLDGRRYFGGGSECHDYTDWQHTDD